MQRTIMRRATGVGLLALAAIWGCGDDGGDTTDPTTTPPDETPETRTAFPTGLAVASPLEGTGSTSRDGQPGMTYAMTVEWISRILDGRTPAASAVDAYRFFTQPYNAPCFGPQLLYENHPDGDDLDPPPGFETAMLPTGDLGIWVETEDGEACAAAQLNARMQGVQSQGSAALSVVAAMIQSYTAAGNTWPDDVAVASTEELTDEMNDLGISDMSFTQASMTRDTDGATWHYSVSFEADDFGTDRTIMIDLHHHADPDAGTFEGLLTWSVENEMNPPGNCGSSDITRNGSLHYNLVAVDDLRLQARQATFCGHGPAGFTTPVESDILSGSVLDPASSWANDYSVFTSEFDPSTLAGRHVFVWQAGVNDSHSRILAVGLSAAAEAGEAYFGYGHGVETTDGSIAGFICNWAGPGGTHTLLPYAQRQHVTLDATSGVYAPTNDGASDITYAPTNDCGYDGEGEFVYDRDLDGDLEDEDAATVNVGPGEVLELDLMSPGQGVGSIWEAIRGRGFDLPAYPE